MRYIMPKANRIESYSPGGMRFSNKDSDQAGVPSEMKRMTVEPLVNNLTSNMGDNMEKIQKVFKKSASMLNKYKVR